MTGRLLNEAPRGFIFEQSGFVADLIEHATTLGKKCHDSVASSLWGSAISGVRHGTPGQPFPEDVELRDRCLAMLAKLPRRSAAWLFFDSMRRSVEEDVRRKDLRDEELLDA